MKSKNVKITAIFIVALAFTACESVYNFQQNDFEVDVVVTCILDGNGVSIVNIEQTYPVVGYSDLTVSNIDDFEIELYEDGVIIEKLMVTSLGRKTFKTMPKVGYGYYLKYFYKGEEVVSDVVVIPKALKNISISQKTITDSKLNPDNEALEVTVLAELEDESIEFINFRILARRNSLFESPNTFNPERDGLLEDPCNENGIFDSFVVSQNCAINNQILKALGAELEYYNNGTFFYSEFQVVVESMNPSYKLYITDINIDSIERAFVPYFSAYSNMSNGIGVITARYTNEKLRITVN